jgi:hypothetical protein
MRRMYYRGSTDKILSLTPDHFSVEFLLKGSGTRIAVRYGTNRAWTLPTGDNDCLATKECLYWRQPAGVDPDHCRSGISLSPTM